MEKEKSEIFSFSRLRILLSKRPAHKKNVLCTIAHYSIQQQQLKKRGTNSGDKLFQLFA
jgi:hypothetical protein